jgi:regulator of RNase E activity RraA
MRIMNARPIREGYEMDFKTLKRRMSLLDTACLCDADKNLRVMDPEIHPITQGLKMVGIARTVRCESDFLTVIKALHDAKEDEVLVVAAGAKKIAVAGELFTTEAKRKNLGGIVIDGGCRDMRSLKKIDFPVYARFVTPLAGTVRHITKTQIPVVCGGVTVSPGDIVFGDDDGIVVMGKEECVKIIDVARDIQKREEKVLELMADNQSLIDMMNFSEHYDTISKGQKSELVFTI